MKTRVFRAAAAALSAFAMSGCDLSGPFRVLNEERVVESVRVSPATVSASPGDTIQLTAAPLGAGSRTISEADVAWSSGDDSIARSLGNGRFLVVALGDAQLFATSRGRRGQAVLLVVP
jgi:hypothetical protein